MIDNREKLVPSADLAEFYTKKIATCLYIIYGYRYELDNHKRLIVKINLELQEIYKQIKHRLIQHEYKDLVKKYEGLEIKMGKLKPLSFTHVKEDGTGNRIKRGVTTPHYRIYKQLVSEKECLIWECLDVLGLLGKVEKQGRKLR